MIKKTGKNQPQKMTVFGQIDQKKWLKNLNENELFSKKSSTKSDQKPAENKAQNKVKIFQACFVGGPSQGQKMDLFEAFFRASQPLPRARKRSKIGPKTEVSSWKVRVRKGVKWPEKGVFFAQKHHIGTYSGNPFMESEGSGKEFFWDASIKAPLLLPHHGLGNGFRAIVAGFQNRWLGFPNKEIGLQTLGQRKFLSRNAYYSRESERI